MKKITGLFLALIFAISGCLPSATFSGHAKDLKNPGEISGGYSPKDTPITLNQCYELALKQSETLGMDHELIMQAEAHFMSAMGLMLPHVSFSSTDSQQDIDKNIGSSSVYDTSYKQSERKFVIKQTLFDGFKILAATSGSNIEQKQRINERIWGEQILLKDVSNAFYLLAEMREDLQALQIIRSVLVNRIKELKAREKIGRSRKTEVVDATVQLSMVEAEIEQTKGRERLARHLLEFYIGRKVRGIAYDKALPKLDRPESECILRADDRPDVRAAYNQWQIMKKSVIVANSGFLPTVSLDTNYYTQRTSTVLKDTDWDAAIKLNVPIFEGTETIGSMLEAVSKEKEYKLRHQRSVRLAVTDIRDSYVELHTALSRYHKLKKAAKAAELSYSLEKRDYDKSLVSNIDVLLSIKAFNDTKRAYIHSIFEAKRLYWKLMNSIGDATKEKLNELI